MSVLIWARAINLATKFHQDSFRVRLCIGGGKTLDTAKADPAAVSAFLDSLHQPSPEVPDDVSADGNVPNAGEPIELH